MDNNMFKDFQISKISRIDLRLMGFKNAENLTDDQMKGIASIVHHKLVVNNFLHKCIEEAINEVIK